MPLSSFDPTSDLRNTQIAPGASPRLQGAQDATDAAAGSAAAFDLGGSARGNASDFGSFLRPRALGFRGTNTQVAPGGAIANPGGYAGAAAQTDAAGAALGGFNPSATTGNYAASFGNYLAPDAVNFQGAGSADLNAFRQQRRSAADAVATGPSRSAIATQRLSAFDTASAPQLRNQEDAVAQRAAALGSLGAGRTSVETLRPYTDYLTKRSAMVTGLAADTAEGEIADRQHALEDAQNLVGQEGAFQQGERNTGLGVQQFNVGTSQAAKQGAVSAALSATGQDANYGLGRFSALGGLETARYGEAAGDRGYTTDVATGNVARDMAERDAEQQAGQYDINNEQAAKGNALSAGMNLAGASGGYGLSRLSSLAGLEGQRTGQEASDRNELRLERGYQGGVEDQGYQRGIQKTTLEDALTNSAFGRSLSQYQVGNQNNPSSILLALSQLYGNNAAQAGGALSGVLQGYGMRAGMGGGGYGGGYGGNTGNTGSGYDPTSPNDPYHLYTPRPIRPTVPVDDGSGAYDPSGGYGDSPDYY